MASLVQRHPSTLAVPRASAAALHGALPRLRPNLLVGGALVALLLAAALFAPLLTPFAPDRVMAGPRLAPPDAVHLFGTDALGRDLFSRVLYGAQLAVYASALGVLVAALLGIAPGLVAGYSGGRTDRLLSRIMDVWLAFPGLLLALVIVARLGPALENAILALGVVSAPAFYRITRNQTLSIRRAAYIEAAQAAGVPPVRILVRHILPNLASSLVVTATLRAGILLLACGGLSFLGLGAQPPAPEWGALLASGRSYMDSAPWLALYPGLCLTLTVVGLNLLGDGLRDLLDPHQRPCRFDPRRA